MTRSKKTTIRNAARRGISGRGIIDAKLQSVADKAANRMAKQMSRPQTIRGRGGFWGDRWGDIKNLSRRAYNFGDESTKNLPPGTFAALGSKLGPMGGIGGQLLSQLTGRGDYQVKKNSIMHAQVGPEGLSFSPEGSATIRVQKREFLGVLRADSDEPAAFRQQQFRLQCTDGHSFPWLAGIAAHFTEWEIEGAVVSYESTSSNYSASMALGTVAIATQYNSNELPYADMTQMLQSAFHTRGNPSEDLVHGIECDPSLQASSRLYTRRPGTKGPANLYDHGVVTIATEGLPTLAANEVIGRLYVTYDINLSLPTLPIKAPFANLEGVCSHSNIAVTEPPLGPSQDITDKVGSPLTFGQTAGDNVLLMSAATGPVVQPTLTPAQENNLVAWINDSTLTTNSQYMSFARAGRYLVRIGMTSWGATGDPGSAAISAEAVGGLSFTQFDYLVSLNGGFGERAFLFNIDVVIPGSSIQFTNADGHHHTSVLTLYVC